MLPRTSNLVPVSWIFSVNRSASSKTYQIFYLHCMTNELLLSPWICWPLTCSNFDLSCVVLYLKVKSIAMFFVTGRKYSFEYHIDAFQPKWWISCKCRSCGKRSVIILLYTFLMITYISNRLWHELTCYSFKLKIVDVFLDFVWFANLSGRTANILFWRMFCSSCLLNYYDTAIFVSAVTCGL